MADVKGNLSESERERKRDKLKRYAKRAVRVPLKVRTSDLPKRAASAVIMLAGAGLALWAGGWVWSALVVLVALGVFWEWLTLVRRFVRSSLQLAVWSAAGALYITTAGIALLRARDIDVLPVLALVGAVIATDIGAYFTGRTIGGPKIAPRISPSKTWAGLLGGIAAATLFLSAIVWLSFDDRSFVPTLLALALLLGPLSAIVAQAGDFFESWMKRRAGLKDSGHLIPGHGGLFDRVDGLMAVCVVVLPIAMLIA